MKNNTCCQYIGCIGGRVTLLLRCCSWCIVMSHMTSTFNMVDVNIKQHDSFMATPTLKSKAGDRKLCKKKNRSWLFGADRKIHLSRSLFGITWQLGNPSLRITVWHHSAKPRAANSDPRTDFSIGTSHSWKILIICKLGKAETIFVFLTVMCSFVWNFSLHCSIMGLVFCKRSLLE